MSLRSVAIARMLSGYANSTPFYSPCIACDCFVPRNDRVEISLTLQTFHRVNQGCFYGLKAYCQQGYKQCCRA
ncbi:MAG: hypothetical protein JWR09_3091 [Mucilaginibacter sp.]|nr:hypothetical protein [Mucilaginibacter sp.]